MQTHSKSKKNSTLFCGCTGAATKPFPDIKWVVVPVGAHTFTVLISVKLTSIL